MEALLRNVCDSIQLVLDILKASNLGLCLFHIKAGGVVGVELGEFASFSVAFGEVFVVVEGTVVGWDTVEVAHVFGFGALFVGEEGFVHLFAVADADDLNVFFLATEELAYGFGLGLDGAGWGFLYEDVTVLAVFEGEEDEVYGFFEAHDETGHVGFGEGDGVAVADLVYPQWDDGAT